MNRRSRAFTKEVKGKLDELGIKHRDVEVTAMDRAAIAERSKQKSFGFDTTHGFLGEEFLTWLWFRWETLGGEFTLPGGRVVGISFDDFIAFAAPSDDETEQTLRHGLPTRSAEARAGLRQGHRLSKARLLIAEGARQWSIVLNAEHMTFSSVKLPEDAEEAESAQDRTADRAANWLVLYGIVGLLFEQFLQVRVGETWLQKEAPAMAEWMRS